MAKVEENDDFINIEPGTFKREELIKADKESAAQNNMISRSTWII